MPLTATVGYRGRGSITVWLLGSSQLQPSRTVIAQNPESNSSVGAMDQKPQSHCGF